MYVRKGKWYSDFWYKGNRYVKSHGPVNKTVAKEKDRIFRAEVASGKYAKKTDNPTFEKAMEEHLKKSKAQNQPSTYERNKLGADHLVAHFGNYRIQSIENNEILMRQYVKKRKEEIKARQMSRGREEQEVTYTTINRELALMRTMFNVLIKAGKATKNPVSLVTFFEEVQKERVLSYEEREQIFDAIEKADKRYSHLKDMVAIALNTGMRQGEIIHMGKSWISLESSVITVPRHSMKRKKKDKRVPIGSAIRPIIERLLKENPDSPCMFINPRTGKKFTSIQNSWNGILKKAGLFGKPGVDKLRFHDLRHTAATLLGKSGKDIKFIAQYLGHSDVRTSARYIHYSDEDLKEGAEILGQVPSKFTTPNLEIIEGAVSTRNCSGAHSSAG